MSHPPTARLDPTLTTFVRRDGTVQIGWDPERSHVVTPPEGADASAVVALLALLDGRIPRPHVVWRAMDLGFAPSNTSTLLAELDETGLMIQRTDADQGSAALVETVHIVGRGPLADAVAVGLMSAPVTVTRSTGSPTQYSYTALARRSADLVVLADDLVPDPRLVADLLRLKIAHLSVRIREGKGVVGPLVRPGASSCLRCADLTRCALDPEWPHISAQMLGTVGHGTRSTVLATAALTLAQVEALLSGGSSTVPETVDCTIELDVRTSSLRKRRWTKHPQCECWPR